MTTLAKVFTRPVRKYIYAVSLAAAPLLIYVGWIDPKAAPLALGFILALLNLTPKEVSNDE